MNAKVFLTMMLAVLLSLPLAAQESQSQDDKEKTDQTGEGYDGYGGASKKGTGPGLSVTGDELKPNRENVQTEKNNKKAKKKAIDKMRKKEGGAEKSGG